MLSSDNLTYIVEKITEKLKTLLKEKEYILVALDGRCAAGKTTLGIALKETLNCNLIHADSFFLRPEQRSAKRLAQPGGNVDYERILDEIIEPWKRHKPFSYRPFSCKMQELTDAVTIMPKPVTIIEGAYSCHPSLCDFYDLKIFLDIDEENQRQRVQARNAENAAVFFEKWIPLEENYLQKYLVKENSDMCF